MNNIGKLSIPNIAMYRNFINRCSGFKQNIVSQATEVQQYCDLVATAYN